MLKRCRRPDPAALRGPVHPGLQPILDACVEHLLVPAGPLDCCVIGRLLLARDGILFGSGVVPVLARSDIFYIPLSEFS